MERGTLLTMKDRCNRDVAVVSIFPSQLATHPYKPVHYYPIVL